ncbi:MAG: amidohydrolase family protein [Chloroflexota bacterium]
MIDLLLKNARPFDETAWPVDALPECVDIAVDDGVIVERGFDLNHAAHRIFDLKGHLLVPGIVESHLHLDIAVMNSWQRPGRPEPYLSHYGLNDTLERRRRAFTQRDIVTRAGQALEAALRHGVTHVRAQCHVDPEVGLTHVHALQEVKERYDGRVSVQIVTFPQQGLVRDETLTDLFRRAFAAGADVMGGAPNLDRTRQGVVNFKEHIDAALELAMALDVDLDVHVDLAIPDEITLNDLEIVHLARRTIEAGYQGRVTAGHACALGSATPEVAAEAISLIKEADLTVVSQPDLYRLGRDDARHVRRGLTRVKELLAAGVNVTCASNNVRDALRPLGNFDLLEESLVLAYGAHMDAIEELDTLLRMTTYHGARALRLPRYGLQPGCVADMVVLDTVSPSAAIVDQAEKQYVFREGNLLVSNRTATEYHGRGPQVPLPASAA